MANVNTPFSQLPLAIAIDGSEVIPLDQGGTTKQATLNLVINGAIQTNFPGAIEFIMDAGTSILTTGVKGYLEVPFNCTIGFIDIYGNTTGSATIDVWACTYDQFDAGSTHPVLADSILLGSYPSFTADTKARVSYGNEVSVAAQTVLAFYLSSVSGLSRLTTSIKITREPIS